MKFLKDARKRAGLSQEELAEILEVHVNTISNWERDESKGPSTQQLVSLCRALNVSEDELLNGPSDDTWKFTFSYNIGKEEINMTGERVQAVNFNFGEKVAAMTLQAGYEVFASEEKFNDLVEQLKGYCSFIADGGKRLLELNKPKNQQDQQEG